MLMDVFIVVDNLYYGMLAFAICAVLIPLAMIVARRIGLIDEPGKRKKHAAPTPLIGGVAIYLAVLATAVIAPSECFNLALLVWIGLVLAIGVLDDLYDVSYKIRLFCHACVVVGIFATSGLFVGDVGAITAAEPLRMTSTLGVFFTVVGVVGVVNAVNMSDGADGLLGSLLLVSFTTIFFIALSHGEGGQVITAPGVAMLVGAVSAFMLFNSRVFGRARASVFMGDAGSTALGFVLAYLLIDYSQGKDAVVSPVVAGWVVGLPLLDASGVILHRVLSRRSPFAPDRSHLHHLLMDAGYSVNRTVLTVLALHGVMIGFSLLVFNLIGDASEAYLFWGFVALVMARAIFAMHYDHSVKASEDRARVDAAVGLRGARPDVSVMVGTTSGSPRIKALQKTDLK